MPEEGEYGTVIITTKDVYDELQSLSRRVARMERFIYTVTGGGIVIGVVLGWVAQYVNNHI
jgi:hypothetical protein